MYMITLLTQGHYHLLETKNQTKILILNGEQTFAWVNAAGIGEILVTSHKSHVTDTILSIGQYRLYRVKDEARLTDMDHLELHVGNGTWQGYLLPTGLPTEEKKRNRVIPTDEVITKVTV
jgi:hypothetical protein